MNPLIFPPSLTPVCFSQGGQEHGGPLLGLLLAAEVEGDAVVRRRHQAQLVARRRLHLVVHRPQIELGDRLETHRDKQRGLGQRGVGDGMVGAKMATMCVNIFEIRVVGD